MKKYVGLLLYSIVAFAGAYAIVSTKHIEYQYFVKIDFLFTFLGVLIGFALTLFTHVVGLIERLKTEFEKLTDILKKTQKLSSLDAIYDEMRDDITFLFIALALVVVISIFSGILKDAFGHFSNVHHISRIRFLRAVASKITMQELVNIKASLLLAIFGLPMLSIKDLIQISFRLSRFVIFKKD